MVFSTEEIRTRESSAANTKSPQYNGISTSEVAHTEIADDWFNKMELVRSASVALHLPQSLIVTSQILVQVSGGILHS